MKGTFKPGDKLNIEKIFLEQVRKGDLIIFRFINRASEDFIVHRVVEKKQGGLVTRGDNSGSMDEKPVTEENIIGRVTRFDRNGNNRKAWNGKLGMLRMGVLHFKSHAIRTIKFFLRNPYLKIRETGLIAKFWRPTIETLYFKTPDGPLVKYVHKGKTIATCWSEKNQVCVKKPYDLIIGLQKKVINSIPAKKGNGTYFSFLPIITFLIIHILK